MQLEHEFTVPVPIEEAWGVLLDVQRIAPCMPGATLETVDGDDFTGKVKVKVGPITVTYGGRASILNKDQAAHTATIEAKGKETRGSGTAAATVSMRLHPAESGEATQVAVTTDLAITGKPAQFGRGVMADVGAKIIGQFADCLAEEITTPQPATSAAPADSSADASPDAGTAPAAVVGEGLPPAPPGDSAPDLTRPAESPLPPTPAAPPPSTPQRLAPAPAQRRSAEAIDLLDAAGGPLARRVGPAVAAMAALAAVFVLVRRRRR